MKSHKEVHVKCDHITTQRDGEIEDTTRDYSVSSIIKSSIHILLGCQQTST